MPSSKPSNKKPTKTDKKAAPKNDKKTSKGGGKKVKKQECIGFICGGNILKTGCTLYFATDNSNVEEYIKENFVKYFGNVLNGRYIHCENAEEELEKVLKLANDIGYKICEESDVLNSNIGESTKLLKKSTGSSTVHTLTIGDKKHKTTKKKTNTETKEEESDEEKEEEEDNESDNVSDAESSDESEKSESSDEESENNSDSSDEEPQKKQKDKKKAEKTKNNGKNKQVKSKK